MKIILLFLFPFLGISQQVQNDTIIGNVQSVREKMIFLDSTRQTYKLFSEEGDYGHHGFMNREFALSRNNLFWYKLPWVHYVNYYREYDTLNRIKNETWYYKNGDKVTSYQFQYDKNDNLIEEKEIDDEGDLEKIKRWGYDSKNRLISNVTVYFKYDTGYLFEGYTYDKDDNLVEEVRFSDEKKIYISNHEYKNKKRIRTYHSYEPSYESMQHLAWKPLLFFEYEYDDSGNKTATKKYNIFEPGEKPPQIVNLKYDERNNLVESTKNNDVKFTWNCFYNEKNQLIREMHIVNGKTTINNEFIYRDDKLQKLLYEEDGVKTLVEYEYEFDNYNNWTKQTKIINGKPLYIRRREIKYY